METRKENEEKLEVDGREQVEKQDKIISRY